MIMPSKYLREEEALLGVGASILKLIEGRQSLVEVWEKAKSVNAVGNFERFVLALDLLFLLGLVEFSDNELVRVNP